MYPARTFDLGEPSLAAYAAGLDEAHLRWASEAADILNAPCVANGAFRTADAYTIHGMTVVAGSGDYAGWQLSGYAGQGPRQGYYLMASAEPGQAPDLTVGFIVANADGSWTASHDAYNRRPGVTVGSSGTKVKLASAHDACRYIIARQAMVSATRH
jgi:hypothetical protein